jgi:hypothetical protein
VSVSNYQYQSLPGTIKAARHPRPSQSGEATLQIFVGRDGTIKGIRPGFASPASGQFNDQLTFAVILVLLLPEIFQDYTKWMDA